MAVEYMYILVDPATGRDIAPITLASPLVGESGMIQIGPPGEKTDYWFRSPTAETDLSPTLQIEYSRKRIEELRYQMVAEQDRIDELEAKIEEESKPEWEVSLTKTEMILIRQSLEYRMNLSPFWRNYAECVSVVEKFDAAIDRANCPDCDKPVGVTYPEMMKYPGKITVGDYSGLK